MFISGFDLIVCSPEKVTPIEEQQLW